MAESQSRKSWFIQPKAIQNAESKYTLVDGRFFDEQTAQDDKFRTYYPEEDRMPYESERQQLGKGASGIAYRVSIQAGYFQISTRSKVEVRTLRHLLPCKCFLR